MIDRKHYGIISFQNSQSAGQALLRVEALFEARLIPLPPQLSAGCGLVLQFSWSDVDRLVVHIKENQIPYTGVYEVFVSGQRKKTLLPWIGGSTS